RSGLGRGDGAREAALARAEHEHAVADAGLPDLERPVEGVAERVEERRVLVAQMRGNLEDGRPRLERHQLGHPAPEAGRLGERDQRVRDAVAALRPAALQALAALAAADARLDG